MTTLTTTDRLRALDPADTVTDPALRTRLDARVLTIPSTHPDAGTALLTRGRGRRPTRRRVALLAGAAAAVTAGSLVLPGLGGGEAAYATWSTTPTAVTPRDLDAVVAACRDQLDGGWLPWDTTPSLDAGAAAVALAERRGDYVAVLLRPRDGADLSAFCVATNPAGSRDVSEVETGLAGSSGPAATTGPTEFLEGSMAEFGGDRAAAFVDGVAGADVVGVRIHDPAGRSVDATVADGRYVAWWPGSVFGDGPVRDNGDRPTHTVEVPGGGNGGPVPQLRYDVTLRDGSVHRGVAPSMPTWPVP